MTHVKKELFIPMQLEMISIVFGSIVVIVLNLNILLVGQLLEVEMMDFRLMQ